MRIPRKDSYFIRKKCELAAQAWRQRTKPLTDSPFRTIRAGKYRALAEVDIPNNLLKIINVGHRKNIYRKL